MHTHTQHRLFCYISGLIYFQNGGTLSKITYMHVHHATIVWFSSVFFFKWRSFLQQCCVIYA